MCILELFYFNMLITGGGEAAKTKTTRRRRLSKKKGEATATVKAPATGKAKKVEEVEETDDATKEEK
jgi:hypothetical protein